MAAIWLGAYTYRRISDAPRRRQFGCVAGIATGFGNVGVGVGVVVDPRIVQGLHGRVVERGVQQKATVDRGPVRSSGRVREYLLCERDAISNAVTSRSRTRSLDRESRRRPRPPLPSAA